jgi:hypothetical protein
VARDQRTRLNAELAHQYGGARKRGAEPGRGSLTGELVEKQDVAPDGAELEEQELEGQDSVEQEVERTAEVAVRAAAQGTLASAVACVAIRSPAHDSSLACGTRCTWLDHA